MLIYCDIAAGPYESLYSQLNEALAANANQHSSVIAKASSNLKSCEEHLEKLRILAEQNSFDSNADEINFFKKIKPCFFAQWIYWREIFQIESRRPLGSPIEIENYLRRHNQNFYYFFIDHMEFIFYLRQGLSFHDEIYFLRKNQDLDEWLCHYIFSFDRSFSTSRDELVSRVIAYEQLQEYLKEEIEKIKNGSTKVIKDVNSICMLQWTASKASLVELIYALQSGGAYNNGNAGVKQIAGCFEKLFQVELGNYFNTFSEIRLRKKNRTSFLDHIKEKLILRMDEADER